MPLPVGSDGKMLEMHFQEIVHFITCDFLRKSRRSSSSHFSKDHATVELSSVRIEPSGTNATACGGDKEWCGKENPPFPDLQVTGAGLALSEPQFDHQFAELEADPPPYSTQLL